VLIYPRDPLPIGNKKQKQIPPIRSVATPIKNFFLSQSATAPPPKGLGEADVEQLKKNAQETNGLRLIDHHWDGAVIAPVPYPTWLCLLPSSWQACSPLLAGPAVAAAAVVVVVAAVSPPLDPLR